MNEPSLNLSNRLVESLSKYIPVTLSISKSKSKWLSVSKPKPITSIGQYNLDRDIGRGRHCEVKLAWRDGVSYAIKLIPLSVIDDKLIDTFERELEALKTLQHSNVVHIEEAVVGNEYLGLVMEWARGGDMFQFIKLNGPITRQLQMKRWVAQLVAVMDFLQVSSFAHHDIKPENILISKEGNLILTDFEMGEWFRKQGFPFVEKACGSVTYCAPEIMLQRGPYDACKAEVWALGVTLYTMAVGYLPFDDHLFAKQTVEDIAKQYEHINNTEPNFPDFVDEELRSLISGMLVKDPTKRLSIPEIKQHPYIQVLFEPCNMCDKKLKSSESSQNSAGSLFSDISQQTISTLQSLYALNPEQEEFNKPVRGPIIWDPDSSGLYLPNPLIAYYDTTGVH